LPHLAGRAGGMSAQLGCGLGLALANGFLDGEPWAITTAETAKVPVGNGGGQVADFERIRR